MNESNNQNNKPYIDPTVLYSLEQTSMISMVRPNDIMLMYSFVNEYPDRIPECIRDGESGKLFFTGDNVMIMQSCYEKFSDWLDKNYDEHGRRRYIEESEDIEDFDLSRDDSFYEENAAEDDSEHTDSDSENIDEDAFFDDETDDEDDESEKKKKKKKKYKNPDEASKAYYDAIAKANKEIEQNRQYLQSEEFKKLEERKQAEERKRIQDNIDNYNREIRYAQAAAVVAHKAVDTEADSSFISNVSKEYTALEQEKKRYQEIIDRNNEDLNKLRAEYGIREEQRKIFEEEQFRISEEASHYTKPKEDYSSDASFKYDSEKHRGFDFSFNGKDYNADEYIQKQDAINEALERDAREKAIINSQQKESQSQPHESEYTPPKPESSTYTKPENPVYATDHGPANDEPPQRRDDSRSYSGIDFEKYKSEQIAKMEETRAALDELDKIAQKEASITKRYGEYIYESTVRDSSEPVDSSYYKAMYGAQVLDEANKYAEQKEQYLTTLKHQEDQLIIAEATYKADIAREKFYSDLSVVPAGLGSEELEIRKTNITNRYISEVNSIYASSQEMLSPNSESRIVKDSDFVQIKEHQLSEAKNNEIEAIAINEKRDIANLKNLYDPSSQEYRDAVMNVHRDSDTKRAKCNIAYIEGLHEARSQMTSSSDYFRQTALAEVSATLSAAHNLSDDLKANAILETSKTWEQKAIEEAGKNLSATIIEANTFYKDIDKNSSVSSEDAKGLLRSSFAANVQKEAYKNYENNVKAILLESYKDKASAINQLSISAEEKAQRITDLKQNLLTKTIEVSEKTLNVERTSELRLAENRAKLNLASNSGGKLRELNVTERNNLALTKERINASYDAALNDLKERCKNQVFPLISDNSILASGKNIKLDALSLDSGVGASEAALSNSGTFVNSGRYHKNLDRVGVIVGAFAAHQIARQATQLISGTDLGGGVHEAKDVVSVMALPLAMFAALSVRTYAKDYIRTNIQNESLYSALIPSLNAMREKRELDRLDKKGIDPNSKEGKDKLNRIKNTSALSNPGLARKDMLQIVRLNYKDVNGVPIDLRKYTKGQLKNLAKGNPNTILGQAALMELNHRGILINKKGIGKTTRKIRQTLQKVKYILIGGTDFDEGYRTVQRMARITRRSLEKIYRITRGATHLLYLGALKIEPLAALNDRIVEGVGKATSAVEGKIKNLSSGAKNKVKQATKPLANKVKKEATKAGKAAMRKAANSKAGRKINSLRKRGAKFRGRIGNSKLGKGLKRVGKGVGKAGKGLAKVNLKAFKALKKLTGKIGKLITKVISKLNSIIMYAVLILIALALVWILLTALANTISNYLTSPGVTKLETIINAIAEPEGMVEHTYNYIHVLGNSGPVILDPGTDVKSFIKNLKVGDVIRRDASLENKWYRRLYSSGQNEGTPTVINNGSPVYGFRDYSSLRDEYDTMNLTGGIPPEYNKDNIKSPKTSLEEMNSFGGDKVPAQIINFYNGDGYRVYPRNNNSVAKNLNANSNFAALSDISNLKTIIAAADIKMEYGGLDIEGDETDDAGLDWPKWKYNRYCTRLFNATHFVKLNVSEPRNCEGGDCEKATWYCNYALPKKDDLSCISTYDAKDANIDNPKLSLFDPFKDNKNSSDVYGYTCVGVNEYPVGYYYCNTGVYEKITMESNNSVMRRSYYDSKGNSVSKPIGDGKTGCQLITCDDGVKRYFCPGHPYSESTSFKNMGPLETPLTRIRETCPTQTLIPYSKYSECMDSDSLFCHYDSTIKYTHGKTETEYDNLYTARKKGAFSQSGDKTYLNLVIDNDIANAAGVNSNSFPENLDGRKFDDAMKKVKNACGGEYVYLSVDMDSDENLIVHYSMYTKTIPLLGTYYYIILSDMYHAGAKNFVHCESHPSVEMDLEDPNTYEIVSCGRLPVKVKINNSTTKMSDVSVPVRLIIPKPCLGCAIEEEIKETKKIGYYTYCAGHTMKYCTGHVSLLTNSITEYIDDDVNNPIIPNDSGTVYYDSKKGYYRSTIGDISHWSEGVYNLGFEDRNWPIFTNIWWTFNQKVENVYSEGNQIDWLTYSPEYRALSYPAFVKQRAKKDVPWKDFYSDDSRPFTLPDMNYEIDKNQSLREALNEGAYAKRDADGNLITNKYGEKTHEIGIVRESTMPMPIPLID